MAWMLTKNGSRRSVVGGLLLLAAGSAQATSGTWLGTVNNYWDTNVNWSAAVRPYANETATFTGSGNGRTAINLRKLGASALAIRDVVFTGPSCAAYTLGDASGQMFWFMSSGTLTIDEDVVNDQKIGVLTRYGNSATVSTTIRLINKSPVAKLLLNGTNEFTNPTVPNLYVGLRFEGVGGITFNKPLTTNGASRLFLYNHNTGTVTFAGSGQSRVNSLYAMNASASPGNTRVVLNSGTELFFDYGSTDYSIWHEGEGVIEGAGKLRFGTGTGENFARLYIKTGSKLTLRAPVTSAGGLDMRNTGGGGGALVLDCVNTMASNLVNSSMGAISVATIGNRGSTNSNVGCGQRIRFTGSGSRLIYTGAGETTDRLFEFTANAGLEQSGSGDLILSEDFVVGANDKTITLTGSAEGAGEVAGAIGPGSGTTSLAKDGTGLWRLTAANSYAGSTAVRNGTLMLTGAAGALGATSGVTLDGGTLCLSNSVAANLPDRLADAAGITLNGATLRFAHGGGMADYSEAAGALTVGKNASTVSASLADEGYTSTLTFDSLTRSGHGTVDFTGAGLGESSGNRILFVTPPALVNGYIGPWATVNGTALAMYDATRGVYAAPDAAYTNIAARGPDSVIPDDPALNVRISTDGTNGPIALAGESGASVFTLTQLTATPAIVATAGKTLSTFGLTIDDNAGALTVGENAGDGTLQIGSGISVLSLVNRSTNALTVNAAAAESVAGSEFNKAGKGAVVLNGRLNMTGTNRVTEGTLALGALSGSAHVIGSGLDMTGGRETPVTVEVSGASEVINNGNLSAGLASGDRCVVKIGGDLSVQATTNNTGGRMYVGNGLGVSGAILQHAGALNVSTGLSGAAFMVLGNNGGYGYQRLTGGSLRCGEIAIGGNGTLGEGNTSVLDLFDGALTVDKWCVLLAWTKGASAFNLFGGSFSGEGNGGEVILAYNNGSAISAQLNVLGAEAKMFDRGMAVYKLINLSRGGTNTLGAVNLNAGELTLYRAHASFANGTTNTTTPTYFNFNGGLLKAAANSAQLMQGLTAAHVYPGGARIDTAGFDATVNQPLVAPAGYGVSGVALASAGAGYIGAPAVLISGGSGKGATAIALVDLEADSPACGQVTNILVTGAGSGYNASDTLVATLRGGGCLTSAVAGAVSLSANASGSLSKLGAGTLTLGGACTYSGGTTVRGGTLKLGVADALLPGSAVTLDGGTLDLSGFTVTNTVSGSAGTVVNGTLYTEFSPAGTNVVGSQTFPVSTASLAGVYHADVTQDGSCDQLLIQGDIDLSGLSLHIVDLSALSRTKIYTVATVSGAIVNTFGATNLPDARWRVIAGADGNVRVFFSDGTILSVR